MKHYGDLYEQDMKWFEIINALDTLPEEERIERYRAEVQKVEKSILRLTGDPLKLSSRRWEKSERTAEKVEYLLGRRYYLLSKMFEIHCSEAEVKRMESVNAHLYELTCDMFSRTGRMYRNILDLPMDPKDDDLTVEGTLKYWGDSAQDVLHLEDDGFYGSDFTRMILVNATLQRDVKGDLEIISCRPFWNPGCGHKSSMSDAELDIDNHLDDGTTWAESWLRHPKLDHICMCYATHAVVTHQDYPIPDLLRMNTFEVKVDVTVQQISEQDGTRFFWWKDCTEQEFVDKFMHEAQSRPSGESLGEFVWRRGIEYFELEEVEESHRWLLKDFDKHPKMDCEEIKDRLQTDIISISRLPDCRKDDNLAGDFLKALRKIHRELKGL